jgi:hypothetical protein
VKKKFHQFGNSDVEYLAIAIYNTLHGEPNDTEPWEPYCKRGSDVVVRQMRDMAYFVASEFAYEAKTEGIGTVFDWSDFEEEL